MTNAADWALLILAALVTCFSLTYTFRSPWWRNRIGKMYLVKSAILALVLMQNSLSVWVSTEYAGRQLFRVLVYTLGIVSYVVMLWALVREQNEDRRRKRAELEKAEAEAAAEAEAVEGE